MTDIIVSLRPDELKLLMVYADDERRSPTDQAAHILSLALRAYAKRKQIKTKP